MRIIITGADGQLGLELQHALKNETIIPFAWPAFDLLKPGAEEQIFAATPDVIIHTAAYTNVDKAEQEPDIAMAVNADGTERVARAADKVGARLIYISTDYVFDGTKDRPYEERDSTNPLGAYGRSKLEGELRALACCANTLVVRTAWLYSAHGANFVKTIMRLAREQRELRVVNDQHGCPTYAGDLAQALTRIVNLPIKGIAHAAGSGHCTWHELASAIVSLMGVPVEVFPISTKDAGRPALRPAYGVLGNRILAEAGIALPLWKDSLARFMLETRPHVSA
ncbi:MAG: dTDP-4-dehydrorhamnose reductase [Nitrospirales bacterium]|nr:dTDP-4-dehydrorhamnose reductase [Nitrospirales bacterium]